jgi:AraC-like DNA-binding protein
MNAVITWIKNNWVYFMLVAIIVCCVDRYLSTRLDMATAQKLSEKIARNNISRDEYLNRLRGDVDRLRTNDEQRTVNDNKLLADFERLGYNYAKLRRDYKQLIDFAKTRQGIYNEINGILEPKK